MADVNRGNRPLSPHLQIYNLPMAARMSILHRITGCGLALGAVIVVWWFLAAARGPVVFDTVDGIVTSWIGGLVLLGCLLAFWYHFFTGVRHLVWDAGLGFKLDEVARSGLFVLGGAAVMSVLTLIIAFT